jgi:antitoxin component YwqK of YwqJK toxin-antitoxin module
MLNNEIIKEHYPDGKLKQECSFKEGLKDGYERVFMNNGDRVMESEYKEDKLHGEHKRYFQNRLILECNYKDGILEGDYKAFNMITGKLEEHCVYKDGVKV